MSLEEINRTLETEAPAIFAALSPAEHIPEMVERVERGVRELAERD